jgi:hypothetical protein
MDRKNQPAGIHFLSFDQVHWIGESIGVTDLYYLHSMYHIRITRVFKGKETSIDFEINQHTLRDQLATFLLGYFSQPELLMGRPEYVKSDIFSEQEFDKILKEAEDCIGRAREKTRQQKSPLLELCREYGLEPEHHGGIENQFTAKCVTGRPHNMYVSTKSEEWGCGYCRIKGGVDGLKIAYARYRGKQEL